MVESRMSTGEKMETDAGWCSELRVLAEEYRSIRPVVSAHEEVRRRALADKIIGRYVLPMMEATPSPASVDVGEAKTAAYETASRVTQAICDMDPADPDKPNTLCISVGDLHGIVEREVRSLSTALETAEKKNDALCTLVFDTANRLQASANDKRAAESALETEQAKVTGLEAKLRAVDGCAMDDQRRAIAAEALAREAGKALRLCERAVEIGIAVAESPTRDTMDKLTFARDQANATLAKLAEKGLA